MELSVQTKTYLVLGIMVCCFAVLYPKIFHPMIMAGLGLRQSQSSGSGGGDWPDGVHPKLRRPMPGGPGGGPGPRMAAEHAASVQARQQSGFGGRGNVVGLILPVYAIGIVLYLVYTLVKVMGGFKSNSNATNSRNSSARRGNSGEAINDYYRNFHFDPLSGEFIDNHNSTRSAVGGGRCRRDDDGDDGDFVEQNRYERMHRDLEKLLRRVDDQDISENELVQLRSRLEETERQMTSILGAMQNLQQKQAAQNAADADAQPTESTETRQRRPYSLDATDN
ncbi:hypothetical protein BOX15_Mlig010549g1 [Macrostomum lignano]|uniref:Resistance to inhibitors of cholinesterase protein 3 N-terminal domain-containing protein n=1 Tax=Macrostomum lignano TaxID=282301 RepID=A0A267FT20_9PLAT|nr:hypothetical protein BOX15_Mlig010549g1 [Macrostomum lignano]